jgi:hypothetical protein
VFPFRVRKENTVNLSDLPCDVLAGKLLDTIGVHAPVSETKFSHLLGLAKEPLLRRPRRDMDAGSIPARSRR